MGLLSRVASIPHSFVVQGVIGFALLSIGFGVGNTYATRQVVEVVLDDAAKQQAAQGQALIVANKEQEAKAEAQREKERNAEHVAYKLLEEGMAEAEKGREDAEQKLAHEFTKTKQLAESNDGLRIVNEMLAAPEPPAPCVVPAGVRDQINAYIARANRDLAARAAEAGTSGVLESPAASNSVPLSCEDALRRVLAIVEHDANSMIGRLAWEAWAREVLK